MTAFIACLKHLSIAVALATITTGAFAKWNDCTAPLPMNIDLPSVAIPAGLASGEVIPGARASFTVPINCTVDPGEGAWSMTLSSGSLSPLPGLPDVFTATGLRGAIGFRIRDARGTPMLPINYNGALDTFQFDPARQGANIVQGSFELVKLGDAVVGTFGFSTGLHVPNLEWANNGDEASSTLSFSYTITGTAVPTCSVTTVDVAVSLPMVSVSAFTNVGATAGTTPFGILLDCASDAEPSIGLTDATSPSNQSNVLTLAPGSTAAGLGVQVLYQMQPLPLGSASYVYAGERDAPATRVTSLGPRSGATSIALEARYIQTATSVSPGTLKAVATFNLSYN
ncbi:type 1 fimbrial protein [Paraburkholderia sp. LEh10]|uniref:fimbrial protein n=1 Tax=Paraburkholderia sp. LEh10 TaxID=2821353 RepID=UPI001AE7F20A|nr:fimbrial protein [Paraburkholderia sp. LEh10]MBP0592715.1 type 1 fimbrial protein [Paraburkholderia sp. LEh10]